MSGLRAKGKRVSGSSAAALAAAAAAAAAQADGDSGDATAPVDAAAAPAKTAEPKGDGTAKAKANGVHSPPAPAARPNGTSPPTKLGEAKGMGGSGFALGKAGRQASGLGLGAGLLSPPRKLPTKEEYFAKMETALRGMLTPFNSIFELEDAFWALNEYARHLIERGDDAKVRTISTTNIHFVEHCSRLKGMTEMLDALGFRPSDSSPTPAAYEFDAGLLSLAPVVSEAARAAAIAAAAQAKAAREAAGNEDLDADDEAARAASRTYAAGATVPLPAFCSALSLFRRLLVIEADGLSKRVAELPFRLQSDHEYTACAAVGQASDQGPRREMEDEEVVAEPFYAGNGLDAKEQRAAYFGLYDGHGGRQAVEFVVKALHVNFESIVARNPDGNYKDLFREAYLTTDGQLRRRAIHESGCTSISVYLRHMPLPTGSSAAAAAGAAASSSSTSANGLLQVPGAGAGGGVGGSADEKKKSHRHTRSSSSFGGYGGFGTGSGPSQRRLYVANAGDARVVLVRAGGRAERLSYDHKPDLAEETERIEADGGEVRNKRVAGCLAVSRALGDHRGFKDEHDWVSAEPFVREIALKDDDQFVVLACDGVWDVMDDAEVAEFVAAKVKAAELENDSAPAADRVGPNVLMDAVAKALVARALEKESSDNVTAMIVRL